MRFRILDFESSAFGHSAISPGRHFPQAVPAWPALIAIAAATLNAHRRYDRRRTIARTSDERAAQTKHRTSVGRERHTGRVVARYGAGGRRAADDRRRGHGGARHVRPGDGDSDRAL